MSTYRERLLPSFGVWFVVPAVAATLGLVVLAVWGTVAAVLTAVVAALVAAWLLLASSARVEVRDGELRAGRASIPVDLLGRVAVVPAERMTALRGPKADVRAYLCQRSWIARGVVAEVVDPADPVPYWLISSRAPERLVAALSGARDEPLAGRRGDDSGQAHSRQTG